MARCCSRPWSCVRAGARKHPKLACAERIVDARIAEVWVGIEDPDSDSGPTGHSLSRRTGIKVYLFDRDLQEQIRQANKEFIAQALKRAAAARQGRVAKPGPLSQWDEGYGGCDNSRLGFTRFGSLSRTDENSEQVDLGRFQRTLRATGIVASARLEAGSDRIWLSAFRKDPA